MLLDSWSKKKILNKERKKGKIKLYKEKITAKSYSRKKNCERNENEKYEGWTWHTLCYRDTEKQKQEKNNFKVNSLRKTAKEETGEGEKRKKKV